MLTLKRMRAGAGADTANEFRMAGVGFLGQAPAGLAAATGFQTLNVAASIGALGTTDIICVVGYIEFMVQATISASTLTFQVIHVDPETVANDFTDTGGNMSAGSPFATFGARSSPALSIDRVFALIRLQWSNTAATASTISAIRLWGSAA